jgi:amidase
MDAVDLAFAGIARQADLVASGEVSSRELVEVCLERIGRIGTQLNAFRVVFAEQALAEADSADARRTGGAGVDARPLYGVPFAIKDDIDVAGEVTALGTRAYGAPAARDAEIVRRLRAAGAVVIGKANVPELCIWPFTESATWGVTRNPWALERTPGGSSGGSAAAVAAGLVGAALGSDGGGSIRIPAAWCGLLGLKPQRARVPLAPRAEAWHGLSVTGVLTRSVRDAALFHDATAAGAQDVGAPPEPDPPLSEVIREPPRHLRIAVSTAHAPGLLVRLAPDARAALEGAAELLRSLGHEVVERDPDLRPVLPSFSVRYLRGIHDDAAAMAHPERLERRTRAMARAGGLIPDALVKRVRKREADVAARVGGVLDGHDVLLTPTVAGPPFELGRFEGRGWQWTFNAVGGRVPYCAPWNVTGQPSCAVPFGFGADRLPQSIQLVGRPNDEATLLALAAQIEAERPWADRRPAIAT